MNKTFENTTESNGDVRRFNNVNTVMFLNDKVPNLDKAYLYANMAIIFIQKYEY